MELSLVGAGSGTGGGDLTILSGPGQGRSTQGRSGGWTLSAAPVLFALLGAPVMAMTPGWTHSPLPGEGDRAAIGCDATADEANHVCLVVRCEDDFSVGVHVTSSSAASRAAGDAGKWEFTIDRERLFLDAQESDAPYGARFSADEAMLRDRIEQGAYAYVRHTEDGPGSVFISLDGSLRAIAEALYYCAPRVER